MIRFSDDYLEVESALADFLCANHASNDRLYLTGQSTWAIGSYPFPRVNKLHGIKPND